MGPDMLEHEQQLDAPFQPRRLQQASSKPPANAAPSRALPRDVALDGPPPVGASSLAMAIEASLHANGLGESAMNLASAQEVRATQGYLLCIASAHVRLPALTSLPQQQELSSSVAHAGEREAATLHTPAVPIVLTHPVTQESAGSLVEVQPKDCTRDRVDLANRSRRVDEALSANWGPQPILPFRARVTRGLAPPRQVLSSGWPVTSPHVAINATAQSRAAELPAAELPAAELPVPAISPEANKRRRLGETLFADWDPQPILPFRARATRGLAPPQQVLATDVESPAPESPGQGD